jgi:hypothetical protein
MLAMVLLLSVVTNPAGSGPADLAAFYGNTLITVDGGIESHFYYRPDHTFTGIVPQYSFDLKGRWHIGPDGRLCRVFDPPVPRVKNPDCGPMLVHALGEKKAFDNGDSQMLVEGIR